jgi:kumamolisin
VPQGVNPALANGATLESATAPSTPVQVSFVLKARDLAALEAEVTSNKAFSYLSTAQFASTYGQTPAIISKLTSYLGNYGITSTVLPDDLDVQTTGTAGDYNKALNIGLQNYAVPSADGKGTQQIYASKSDPTLPTSVANAILSILGLSNYAPFVSNAVPAVKAPAAQTPAASGTIPEGELTPEDFENRYGLSSVESAGSVGQGETIGIVTLATVNANAPETFWSKYLHLPEIPTVNQIEIDGGSGPASLAAGSVETDLDIEQSGAIADGSTVDVYQAPNTDPGFADAFFTAASDNVADTISSSWGESETAILDAQASGTESSTYAQAFDEAFLEMDAQGESNFIASGDDGAYEGQGDTMTTNLTTGNPSDSPYTTSAGGTTLAGTQTYGINDAAGNPTGATESVTIPTERAWSYNYLWPLYEALGLPSKKAAAVSVIGGGSGGYSTIEARPSYQVGVSGVSSFNDYQYLTGIDPSSAEGISEPTKFAYTASPTLASGTAPSGRAEPDLSYDADPQTGYALYDPQFGSATPVLQYGGTSFVAPQLNGATAVIDSSVGHRVGFWNPTIYAAAQTSTSPFNSLQNDQVYGSKYFFQTSAAGVTSDLSGNFTNDNLYYTGNPGAVYNPATGLGIGDLGRLDTVFKAKKS